MGPRSPSSGRLHDEFAVPLAENIRELGLVSFNKHVIEPRLTTKLVYPLRDLVARCITETGEEGEKTSVQRCSAVLAEDDG